ncbi:serine hydrolase domain-containing protein [Streptomyces sioyaensis]|uniref:serine hydrolase domain-containing protein n=1 Tax=Streptomyces sioyaensis TaxID=67364 RepID=UPI0036595240
MPVPTCVLGSRGIYDKATHGHDPDKYVELGSFTKVVTGTALTQMAREGGLSLDDPIDYWLDEVPKGTGITLQSLADHTSGLPRLPPDPPASIRDPYASFTHAVLHRLLGDLDKVASGTVGKVVYSNLGYAVLGHVLTVAAGCGFQQLVDRYVLAPLELQAGAMTAEPPVEQRLVPRGFLSRPRGLWTLTGPILPAGGLWSTPRTAAHVLLGLTVDRLLGEPAPSWFRASSSMWHNGATRGSSIFAASHEDGRWILLHRLHGNPNRTDRLALKTFKKHATV